MYLFHDILTSRTSSPFQSTPDTVPESSSVSDLRTSRNCHHHYLAALHCHYYLRSPGIVASYHLRWYYCNLLADLVGIVVVALVDSVDRMIGLVESVGRVPFVAL